MNGKDFPAHPKGGDTPVKRWLNWMHKDAFGIRTTKRNVLSSRDISTKCMEFQWVAFGPISTRSTHRLLSDLAIQRRSRSHFWKGLLGQAVTNTTSFLTRSVAAGRRWWPRRNLKRQW